MNINSTYAPRGAPTTPGAGIIRWRGGQGNGQEEGSCQGSS